MIHKKEIQLVAMFFVVAILAGITLVTYNYAPLDIDLGNSKTHLTGYVIAYDAEGKIKQPAETLGMTQQVSEKNTEIGVGNLVTGFATVKIDGKDVTVPDIFITTYGSTGPKPGQGNKIQYSGNTVTETNSAGQVVKTWTLGKYSYVVYDTGKDLTQAGDDIFKFVSGTASIVNPSANFRNALAALNQKEITAETQPQNSVEKYQIIISGDTAYKFMLDGMAAVKKNTDGSYSGTFTNANGQSYPIVLGSVDDLKKYDGKITLLGTIDGTNTEIYGDMFNNYYAVSGGKIMPWKLENQPAGTQITPLAPTQDTKTIDLGSAPDKIIVSSASRVGIVDIYSTVFGGSALNLRDQTSLNQYNQLSQALKNRDNAGNFLLEKENTYSIYKADGTVLMQNIDPQLAQLLKPADYAFTLKLNNPGQIVSNGKIYEKGSNGVITAYSIKQTQSGQETRLEKGAQEGPSFIVLSSEQIPVNLDDKNKIVSLSFRVGEGTLELSAAQAKGLGILDGNGAVSAQQSLDKTTLDLLLKDNTFVNAVSNGADLINTDGVITATEKIGDAELKSTFTINKENTQSPITQTVTISIGGNSAFLNAFELQQINYLRRGSGFSIDAVESTRIILSDGRTFVKSEDSALDKIPAALKQNGLIVNTNDLSGVQEGKWFDGANWHLVDKGSKDKSAWTDSVDGFTQVYCKDASNCNSVNYYCGKDAKGKEREVGCIQSATYVIKDSRGNEVKDASVKLAIAQQINYETTGLRWQAAYQAALGAARFGNMLFCGGKDCFAAWGKSIDNLFRSMFGFVMYPEDTFCKQYVDRGGNEGVAYVATPAGLIDVAAHVEGAKSPLILRPNETAAPNANIGEYLYKFTFYVKIPKYTTSGYERGDPVKFNVELRGQKTVKLFKGDKRLMPGQEYSQKGNTAIVKYSPVAYNEICIVFSGADITWRNPICNKIVEYQGGPTSIEEAAISAAAVDYGSGLAGSGVPNTEW